MDLDDELRVSIDACGLHDDLSAGLPEVLVGYGRGLPRPGLDHHPVTGAGELVDGVGCERHPALPGRKLSRNPYPQDPSPRASATAAAAASKKAVSSA